MRLRGMGRIRKTIQTVRNKFVSSKAIILIYHRVAEVSSDPQLLCVSPKHFAEHLKVLQKHYQPIQLQSLARNLQDGNLADRAVAVTFDDGYDDNLFSAKPLLEKYNIPATVFVTSGYIGEQHEFWWDELDRLLLQPGKLPENLSLDVNGKIFLWELGADAFYSQETYQLYRGWSVLEQGNPGIRQSLYRALCAIMRPLAGKERQKVLEELAVWAGMNQDGRTTHRSLSSDEVSKLILKDLVDVGAHTVSHSVLSTLSTDIQKIEIEGSKQYLEDIIGRPVTTFSYPYGTRSDYTRNSVAIVRGAGFACACSNFEDIVWRSSNPFELPRFLVRDWDGDEFATHLGDWLRG